MITIHPNQNIAIHDIVNPSSEVDLENIFHTNSIDIGQADPHLSDIFMSAVNPLLTDNDAIAKQIHQLVQDTQEKGTLSQDELLTLEYQSGQLSTNITVAAKVVNLGVKFVNELTHLQ